MNYILIGFLFAIGWHVAGLICKVVGNMLLDRIYTAKWYQNAVSKRSEIIESEPGAAKTVKNQIGFM